MTDAVSMERARAALSFLSSEDRNTWVKYGMCLKAGFGDAGFEVWDLWGAQSDKYRASDARSAWRSFKPDGERTIASLFYDAKLAGWKDHAPFKRPTKAELEKRREAALLRKQQADAENAARQEKAPQRARELWEAANECESRPYLARKGVAAHGLRLGRWERIKPETGEVITVAHDTLIIPIYDWSRRIWSLQAIFASEPSKKLFLPSGKKSGHYFPIGKPQKRDGRDVFVLVEGYATGASVHEATDHMVFVCFDASNLLPVAKAIREKFPDGAIVFAADNDTETDGNPGLKAARRGADEVGGLVAVPPSASDFNDLHFAEGPGAVVAAFEEAFASASMPEPQLELVSSVPADPDDSPESRLGHFRVMGLNAHDGLSCTISPASNSSTAASVTCPVCLASLSLHPSTFGNFFFPGKRDDIDRSKAFQYRYQLALKRGVFNP